MNICFISTSTIDPKTKKRIETFQQFGTVSAIFAKRKNHNTDIRIENCEYLPIEIDLPDSNHLFSRLLVTKSFQDRIYHHLIQKKPSIIYAESYDCLEVASKYKKNYPETTIFFEVSDLRSVFFKNQHGIKKLISWVIKKREGSFFSCVNYLTVTSEKFYEERYQNLISREKLIFLPNMPDRSIFEPYTKKDHDKFTIGFVGGIRYINQMIMLVDAAKKCDVRVVFAGSAFDHDSQRLIDYCKDKEYVKFTGEYDFKRDIVDIYESLDCVYSVYDSSIPNVRIALPNKLYEAVLCQLPIIVAKDTYLCELVESWGIGESVGYKDIDGLVSIINRLKSDKEYYNAFVNNEARMKDTIDYQIYNNKLVEVLKTICVKSK